MPQFDILTLGAQISGLLIVYSVFYYLNIKKTIPLVIQVKKFRTKKIETSFSKIKVVNKFLIKNLEQEVILYYDFLGT